MSIPILKDVVAMTIRRVLLSCVKEAIILLFISSVVARVYMVIKRYFNRLGYPAGKVISFRKEHAIVKNRLVQSR